MPSLRPKREIHAKMQLFIRLGVLAIILAIAVGFGVKRFAFRLREPVADAAASTTRRSFHAEKLPWFMFHTTHYKFADPGMRAYQEGMNREGVRMASAYSRIRAAFAEANARPAVYMTNKWRQSVMQNIMEFRTAGRLVGNYPSVPSQAVAEDKEFAPVAELSSQIAEQLEVSIRQNNDSYIDFVPMEVKKLFVVSRLAQGCLERLADSEQPVTPDVRQVERINVAPTYRDEEYRIRNVLPNVNRGLARQRGNFNLEKWKPEILKQESQKLVGKGLDLPPVL